MMMSNEEYPDCPIRMMTGALLITCSVRNAPADVFFGLMLVVQMTPMPRNESGVKNA
jgi:hypothetical protein